MQALESRYWRLLSHWAGHHCGAQKRAGPVSEDLVVCAWCHLKGAGIERKVLLQTCTGQRGTDIVLYSKALNTEGLYSKVQQLSATGLTSFLHALGACSSSSCSVYHTIPGLMSGA